MPKYVVGVDFGTLSARALVVEVPSGRELHAHESAYEHQVMDEALPSGRKLPPDWALQHPQDYLDAMGVAVRGALRKSSMSPEDVIGMGIDFTACTMLPVDKHGNPLCQTLKFQDEPHAFVKLWKHHAAQDQANRINQKAAAMGEAWLERYGGKISSEWMFPKIWQTLEEAPAVYAAADKFIEAADWVNWQLTGVEARNSCTAGYKALWHKREGYPSSAFWKALDPRLEHVVEEKLSRDIRSLGDKAGDLTAFGARVTGLLPGTAVAVANVDAHVSVPAVGITEPGSLLMIMGTSTCHMALGAQERIVPGTCGLVEDGILPGFFGFEAGQSCVGDHFNWFVENCAPAAYAEECRARGIDMHALLTWKAQALKPGESGLLALDWWNGNRSVLVDADLTGLILGMTLATKPEEMYRALIEATAFGTRTIIEAFNKHGVPITALYACGGIAERNPMLMQIYADVTRMEIRIGRSSQAPALGSAMFGAVAAGKERGGFDTIFDAARAMGGVRDTVYRPSAESAAVYDELYAQYARLHDLFGRGACDAMKKLKEIKKAAR